MYKYCLLLNEISDAGIYNLAGFDEFDVVAASSSGSACAAVAADRVYK